jgi:hypothetical protein
MHGPFSLAQPARRADMTRAARSLVPPSHFSGLSARLSRARPSALLPAQAAAALSAYLAADPAPEIIADWPEDLTQFCSLLVAGPALMVPVPPLTFRLIPLPGFSTAANSAVPHNALHDARSLRDHLQSLLEWQR